MNLAPYQDLQFGDNEAFDDFLMSLQVNHDHIAQNMGALGFRYPTYPLGDVEGSRTDWQNNLQAELQSIYRNLNLTGLPDLSGSDLEKEGDWEAFFQLLVYSEMRVNAQLGIM